MGMSMTADCRKEEDEVTRLSRSAMGSLPAMACASANTRFRQTVSPTLLRASLTGSAFFWRVSVMVRREEEEVVVEVREWLAKSPCSRPLPAIIASRREVWSSSRRQARRRRSKRFISPNAIKKVKAELQQRDKPASPARQSHNLLLRVNSTMKLRSAVL
eukprot:scaffold5939_cov165-Ochromonas_danica.AAC.14